MEEGENKPHDFSILAAAPQPIHIHTSKRETLIYSEEEAQLQKTVS